MATHYDPANPSQANTWSADQTFTGKLTVSGSDYTFDDGSGNQGSIKFTRHSLADSGKEALSDVSGIVFVVNETDGTAAIFELDTVNSAAQKISDPSSKYTTTEDNDTTANVYWDATNTQFELNNELGGTKVFKAFYLSA